MSLLVKNTGGTAGEDSVLLFATDLVRRVEPRYKMLKGFDKVSLEPGESKKVRTRGTVHRGAFHPPEVRVAEKQTRLCLFGA